MKHTLLWLSWAYCFLLTAQNVSDSTDMFYRHLELNEVVVSGMTGETKLKNASAPITLVTRQMLHQRAASNLIDAIALQPGVSQITTGGAISKPVIRGLATTVCSSSTTASDKRGSSGATNTASRWTPTPWAVWKS